MAFLYSLANNVAAQSSNLGIVNCFNGATLDVEHRSSQDVLLLLSIANVQIGSFSTVTELMNLDVGSIGANLPVDLEL
jgi:hypothetical protein